MFGAWEAIPWHGIPLEKLNKNVETTNVKIGCNWSKGF